MKYALRFICKKGGLENIYLFDVYARVFLDFPVVTS